MIEISELAQYTVSALAPYLPSLLEYGKEALSQVVTKTVDQGWEEAMALWEQLHPHLASKSSALEAAKDLSTSPQDPDLYAALRVQIKKILNADTELAAKISEIVQQSTANNSSAIASGDRSIAIGGRVTGSAIVTGDNNEVR